MTRALPSGHRFWASARPGVATATALVAIISVAAACGDSNGENPATGISATATVEPTSGTAGGTGPAEGTNPPATANPGSRDPDPAGTSTPQGDTTADPIPATPTPLPAPIEPLTGEPLDDPSIMGRPALAVKTGTSSVGRPQTGINQADILIEVRVETITRLLAVFHSQGVEPLGPVRSARSSDPDILANFSRPVFGHSGANPGVLREVAQGEAGGKLHELRWDDLPTGYWRVRDRVPPFNLYTTTSALWKAAPSHLQAPEPLFQYRKQGDALPPAAEPVPGVEIRYLGGTIAHFVWDAEAGSWARWQDGTPHVDMARNPDGTPDPEADPVQIAPANVVVLQTRYTSSAPCPSCPQAITVDPEGGTALVFTDGHLIRGRWTRPSANRSWQVTGNDGNPVRLTPGQTFIALPGGDVLVMVESFAKNLLKKR
ncbi:DUF3048 domain-containing protein [Candidatus Poriferisocius sp.]|uniref:DUF3048 domain-containing protein n=1 Tax=Candidatus Poriferisocius sp. TaxID=3101276 RepID=UPI003B026972